jgi:hypothetical protein
VQLVVAGKAYAPIAYSEPELGWQHVDEAYYVALAFGCQALDRVDHTGLDLAIEPLQVSPRRGSQ